MAEKCPLSEGHHLVHAYNSGLLERFLSLSPLYGYLSGRTTTPEFSFHIGQGAAESKGGPNRAHQTYVDGGQVVVAEAKIGIPQSFIIR